MCKPGWDRRADDQALDLAKERFVRHRASNAPAGLADGLGVGVPCRPPSPLRGSSVTATPRWKFELEVRTTSNFNLRSSNFPLVPPLRPVGRIRLRLRLCKAATGS